MCLFSFTLKKIEKIAINSVNIFIKEKIEFSELLNNLSKCLFVIPSK